jgi:hypothetical protein
MGLTRTCLSVKIKVQRGKNGGKPVNKDLERVESPNADLSPIMGPMPYAGNPSYIADKPDWMDPVPEYGPTDGFLDTITRIWSYIVRGPRYLAIGFLWITYTPWRFGVLAVTVWLIYTALVG